LFTLVRFFVYLVRFFLLFVVLCATFTSLLTTRFIGLDWMGFVCVCFGQADVRRPLAHVLPLQHINAAGQKNLTWPTEAEVATNWSNVLAGQVPIINSSSLMIHDSQRFKNPIF
jgi:hypothetical protein